MFEFVTARELYDIVLSDLHVQKDYLEYVEIEGWVRTNRNNGHIGFIELNDGTYFRNVQIVYSKEENNFELYASLNTGDAINVMGKLKITEGSKQPFEIAAIFPQTPHGTQNLDQVMDIAKSKRRENIAEYILYLWQLADLLRALQFSPEAIFSTLIAPRKDIGEEQKHVFLLWYMDLANLLRQEGKEEKGHLEHTLHLIQDMHDLHLQLMKLPVGEHYRATYAHLEPELPRLRAVLGNPGMSDTELCFRALYAAMLYRIKGEGGKQAVTDTLEYISPVIAELADMYGKVERGEVDLFKTDGK